MSRIIGPAIVLLIVFGLIATNPQMQGCLSLVMLLIMFSGVGKVMKKGRD